MYENWAANWNLHSAIEHSKTVSISDIENGDITELDYPNASSEGVIIPEGTSQVGALAFQDWGINRPLVIPNTVSRIRLGGFRGWDRMRQPLVLPEGLNRIDSSAFNGWMRYNQPIVIPKSLSNIGDRGFQDFRVIDYFIFKSETPPSLNTGREFLSTGGSPFYVPDSAVDDYKNAEYWKDSYSLADRVFSIKEKEE